MEDINRKVARADTAARQEIQQSPDIIQATHAVRHPSSSSIHKAFCKTDTGAKATMICFLDEDITGEEVTVHCTVASPPKSIEAITLSNPINIEITAHGFDTDDTVRLASVIGISPSLNGEYAITKIDDNNFTLNDTDKAIENITLPDADPVNIKLFSHGLTTGQTVQLISIGGISPSLDGEYTITKKDDDNFTLDGTDSSEWEGTFTSGTVRFIYTGTFVSGTACRINLNQSIPRLTRGLQISVWFVDGIWEYLGGFQHWDPCKVCP